MQPMIDPTMVNQLLVTADFNDTPAVEHHDLSARRIVEVRCAITVLRI